MSTAVKSSEFQKNVGLYLDRINEGPIQITRYDRPAAILMSNSDYKDLISSYRKIISADQLSDEEASLIRASESTSGPHFNLSDLPDVEDLT